MFPDSDALAAFSGFLAPMPLSSAFYGLAWGAAAGAVGLAWEAALFRGPIPAGLAALAPTVLLSLSVACALAFARARLLGFKRGVLARLRQAVRSGVSLRQQNEALERVNRVLESRVSSQGDSITLLHDQVRKLASLSLEQALETILETVARFTGMSSGAIWTMDEDAGALVPAAGWGWKDDAARDVTLDPETTIEGYVYRNKKPFSARMLMDGSEFDRFDTDRTIISMPLIIGSKPWGVLSVEDLPFERYSQYTETILAVLLSLAEPYLRQITAFEALNSQNEVDPETGYPLYSILHRTIAADIERTRHEPGFVSLVILEISNWGELSARWGRDQLKRLLFSLKDDLDKVKAMKTKAFHFKEDSQFALIVYDLDQDGTSFFCLDLLATVSEYRFAIGGEKVDVELIVGFSSSAQGVADVDGMIGGAEHLLSIQRL